MLYLGGGAATLEDLELDGVEGHQPQGEAGHDAGEQDQEAGDAGVDEPPRRAEADVVGLEDQVVGRNHQGPSYRHSVEQQHHRLGCLHLHSLTVSRSLP